MTFVKYPKTYAIDRELAPNTKLATLLAKNQTLVIEEKMDGTQLGFRFRENGKPILQSRGTVISTEKEFALMKSWIWQHQSALFGAMGTRYLLFGEWLWAKHTLFYDILPHYFLEFDIYDQKESRFLSTRARQTFIAENELDFISSVRVIAAEAKMLSDLNQLIQTSAFISDHAYEKLSDDERKHTDLTRKMEGLYLKIEDNDEVIKRYKLIRSEFLTKILSTDEHWKKRKTVCNELVDPDIG